ncbi:MAG: hypothetical protein J7619_29710 [Dyadobacter sp.]|uniref:hypothetical protein n=1 Tax=Dyadobacter sp. TaxID=1914288 RepID=UPI001B18775C|nr:hypothetical protein [Dyadobacter sp.]MBO9616900.1 hypothetical protein [Dyadobacter sp.]
MNPLLQMMHEKGNDEYKREVEILSTETHHHEDHTFEGSEFMDDALRMHEQPLEDNE